MQLSGAVFISSNISWQLVLTVKVCWDQGNAAFRKGKHAAAIDVRPCL